MRSTSVKTAVAAVTLAAALIAAIPAEARPTSRNPSTVDRVVAAMKRLYNNLVGGDGVPVIPLPPPDKDESTRTSKPIAD